MTVTARMRRAEVPAAGRVELRDVVTPVPGPGEILVAVEAALTCGTDVKLVQRGHPRIPLPTPLGHEFAGVVAAVGEGVTGWVEGEPVACVPTAPCTQCARCVRGRENLCPDAVGRLVMGAFADYVLLPPHIVAMHLFRRPAGLSAEAAAALEPLACVVHGADRAAIESGDFVVLLGDGPIALLFAQLVRLRGAGRVLVAGRHDNRLGLAAALGVETTPLGEADLHRLVHAGGGADRVIECVGNPAAWELAHGLAAPGGRVLMYGGCAADTRACFDTARIHYDEIDVVGAFHYRPRDVREALRLLESDAIRIQPLITHRLALADLGEALDLVRSRRAVKVALRP